MYWLPSLTLNMHQLGGYYQCNIYVAGDAVDVKGVQAGERERLRQAEEMRRYTFYFERYRQHKEGVKSAPHLMEAAQNNIRILVEGVSAYRTQHSMSNLDPTYFQFILDMVDLVERCRRVLAWTYVFAYFLPPNSPQMNILQVSGAHAASGFGREWLRPRRAIASNTPRPCRRRRLHLNPT